MNNFNFDSNHYSNPIAQNNESNFKSPSFGVMRFREQPNGYEKEQVDRYIQELSSLYNAMHSKYNEAVRNSDSLKDKVNIMGEAFMKAEIMAQKTVDEANQKALRIVEDAKKIVEDTKKKEEKLSHTVAVEKAAIDRIVQIMDDTKATIDSIFSTIDDPETKVNVSTKIMKAAKEKIDLVFQMNNQVQSGLTSPDTINNILRPDFYRAST